MVKLLYNLLYLQLTVQLTCLMTEAERQLWRHPSPSRLSVPPSPVSTLEDAMALTIQTLDQTQLYMSDDMLGSSVSEDAPVLDKIATEKQVGLNLHVSICD